MYKTNPISIKSLLGKTQLNQKARIKTFDEFGKNLNFIEFFIIKFHDYYDGLIGNDLLIPLEAVINYKNKSIQFGDITLALF